MRAWLKLMGGLVIWALHFFAVYLGASIFPARPIGGWIVLGATVAALALTVWLFVSVTRSLSDPHADPVDRWTMEAARGAAALGLLGIVYQSLPALVR